MTERPLRFLTDESCDFAVVRALRAEGYDVLAVGEVTHRSVDRARRQLARTIVRLVREQGSRLLGAFAVVQPGHVRPSYPPNALLSSRDEPA